MRRCKLCILPETYPGIAFNEEGICNFCLNHKKRSVLGEDELKKVLYSRRGKKYDCVVPVSGEEDVEKLKFRIGGVFEELDLPIRYIEYF